MHNQPHLLASRLPTVTSMNNSTQASNNASCAIQNFRKLGKAATCIAGIGATNCDRYIAPLCGLDPDSILGNIITGGAFSIPLHASLIAGMLEVSEHSTELSSVHESFQIRFMEFVEHLDASHHVKEDEKKAFLALAKMSQVFFQEIIDEQKEKHNATVFYITTLSTMAVLTVLAMTPATVLLPFLNMSAAHIVKGIVVTGIGTLPVILQNRTSHHYQTLLHKTKDFPAQFEAWTHMVNVILADKEHPQHILLANTLEQSGISTEKNREIYTHLSNFISGLYSLDKLNLLHDQGAPRTTPMRHSRRSTHSEILRNLSVSHLEIDGPSSSESLLESSAHHASSPTYSTSSSVPVTSALSDPSDSLETTRLISQASFYSLSDESPHSRDTQRVSAPAS